MFCLPSPLSTTLHELIRVHADEWCDIILQEILGRP
jgi:hypothetical protein